MKIFVNIFVLGILSFVLIAESCKSGQDNMKNDNEPTTDVIEENKLVYLLDGLKILSPNDLNGRDIMIDGISMPVYNETGEQLEGMGIVDVFRDSLMTFDIYGDEKLEPKVVVFRAKTEADEIPMNNSPVADEPPMETMLEYAPSFIINDIEGNRVELEELKGKVVVINFWFIKCKPCIEEMPELNKLVKKYKDNENVVFLGITHDKKEKVTEFLKKEAFDYTLIPDAQSIVNDYIVMGFPTNIVLDKLGDVQYQSMGYRHQIDRIIDGQINKALNK